MLTPKENALRMIYNEKPEYVPMTSEAFRLTGFILCEALECPMAADGYDPFGVYWHVDSLGSIPDNTSFLMEDITDWRDIVKIPDISDIDFKAAAEKELEGCDRNSQLVTYYHPCGTWERVLALMGFENTLCALVEEPEEFEALIAALTDYKIDCASRIIDAYSPDVYVDYSDYATARGLFMSPDTWRELIKPHQQRYIDAVTSRGVLYEQHCCGCCEAIIDDLVEMGTSLWHSAQISNDLVGIEEKYRGRLTVEGGWDSQGKPGTIDATEEDVRAETRRCIEEYGRAGGFILLPVLVNEYGNSVLTGRDPRLPAFVDEWNKCRFL